MESVLIPASQAGEASVLERWGLGDGWMHPCSDAPGPLTEKARFRGWRL